MWIFGQVWFACLVGFAVGVLLDWALRVRPLARRVAELESRASDRASDRGATRVTDYGRAAFAESAPGFEPERPSRSGSSADLLDRPGDDDTDLDRRDRERATRLDEVTRITDFSSAARRDDSWDPTDDAVPAREPWRPERSEDHWHPNSLSAFEQEEYEREQERARREAEPEPERTAPPAAETTTVHKVPTPVAPPTDPAADEQYLDFLRSGPAGDAEATSVLPADRESGREDHADDRAEDGVSGRGALSLSGDYSGGPHAGGFGSSEVTSILPAIPVDEPHGEPTSVFTPYSESSEQSGYRDEYVAEYRPEEGVQEPENPTPLPRRGPGHSTMPRFSPFSPSYDDGDTELSRGGPARITPISQDGFLPFGAPVEEDPADAWQGDPADASAHGEPAARMPDDDGPSWFDLPPSGESENADEDTGDHSLTRRVSPVPTSNGVHPPMDLPPTASTYAEPAFHEYEGDYDDGTEQGPPRSLFEPVVAPDVSEELPKRQPMLPVPPRPVRVRTGMGQPAHQQAPRPEDSGGPSERQDQAAEDAAHGSSARAPRSYQPYGDQEPTRYTEPVRQDEPTRYTEATHDPRPTTKLPPVAPPRSDTGHDVDDGGWSDDGFGGSRFGGDLTGDLIDEPAPPAGAGFGGPGPVGSGQGPHPGGADVHMGPFGPGSALPLPDGSAPAPEFTVKARTSSMVFHTESSPFYDRLEPQVWFRDPQDAQRAGFTSWERPRTW